jgi:hypothetical protein
MNPLNWYEMEVLARQRQAEVEEDLTTRQLLKEAGTITSDTKRTRRVVLRLSTAIIFISWLLHYLLS